MPKHTMSKLPRVHASLHQPDRFSKGSRILWSLGFAFLIE